VTEASAGDRDYIKAQIAAELYATLERLGAVRMDVAFRLSAPGAVALHSPYFSGGGDVGLRRGKCAFFSSLPSYGWPSSAP
jgi:hypothetical protein